MDNQSSKNNKDYDLLIQYLHKVIRHVDKFDLQHLDIPLSLDYKLPKRYAFIEELVEAIKNLIRRLQDEISVRNKDEEELRQRNIELEAKRKESVCSDILNTAQMVLSETIRGDQDITTLSESIVTYICSFLETHTGAFYVVDEKEVFNLAGTYVSRNAKDLIPEYQIEEKLLKQALNEKKHILHTSPAEEIQQDTAPPENAVVINTLVYPFLHDGKMNALFGTKSIHGIPDTNLQFLDQVSESIGLSIHSAQDRIRILNVLDQTQKQLEELKTENQELRKNADSR